MEFVDRLLKCCDCGNEFVFTAGEQIFFFDKQFKNDPKRCKLCKAKRSGLASAVSATTDAVLPLSRTETRTRCSACAIETTVPFKPTQGRPVLCRSCFQMKRAAVSTASFGAADADAKFHSESAGQMDSIAKLSASARSMAQIAAMPLGARSEPSPLGMPAEAAIAERSQA